MRKRVDIGTDIATIGLWDPAHERHDLQSLKYADYQAGLEAEAEAGRLFFVNTSADGSYPAVIYVDEEPDPECLRLYSTVERQFRIESRSGELIAGGIEDFVSASKSITSPDDRFSVRPGSYAVQIHEVVEAKLIDRLREELGEEDYRYYSAKSSQLPWGCLLALTVVLSTIWLALSYWVVSALTLLLGLGYALLRRQRHRGDDRFHEIAERVSARDNEYPPFIYVLRPLADESDVKGGWYDLP